MTKPYTSRIPKFISSTAHGELSVEELTPLTQITAYYGLLNGVLTTVDSQSSGTTGIENEMFTCQSGTDPNGLAAINTLRQLGYRAGQGALARLTGLFDTPQPNSQQMAGLITSENILAFGYQGLNFGIFYAKGGRDELQRLDLTSAAATGGNSTVTIDGASYNVALTGGLTIEKDAYEIATQLNGQVPNYLFSSNGTTVNAQSLLPIAQGIFSYSGGGTSSAGTWTQLVEGQEPDVTFIPQTEWSENKVPLLNPMKGNCYMIRYEYQGFGGIEFYLKNEVTNDYTKVHTISYVNQNTVPSTTNPTFRIGWLSRNLGNTTSLKVQGGSAAGFIEGKVVRDIPPRSARVDQPSIGGNLTSLISFRNRVTFGDKINRAEVLPLVASVSSQTNKSAFFIILLNPIFADNMVFNYVDENNSLVEVSNTPVGVSGGIPIGSITVGANGSQTLEFNLREQTPSYILPGSILSIAALVTGGSSADCQASVSWQEDL